MQITQNNILDSDLEFIAKLDVKWWLRHWAANKTSVRADEMLNLIAYNIAMYGFHKKKAELK